MKRAVGALLLLAVHGSAWAQTESGKAPVAVDKDAAREEFARGVQAYKEGNFAEACRAFERSYELAPNPHVLFNVGKANMDAGKPLEVQRAFEQYLRDAGAELKAERVAEVEAVLTALRAQTARLSFEVQPLGATLMVDGAPIQLAADGRGGALVLPGRHALRASAEGHQILERNVEVAAGKSETVQIALDSAQEIAPPVSEPRAEARAPRARSAAVPVAWGVTGALAAGAVTFTVLWATSSAKHAEERETNLSSPALQEYFQGLTTRTNVFGGVAIGLGAGALVGAGVATWLTVKRPSRSTASWRPLVSPSFVGVDGTF